MVTQVTMVILLNGSEQQLGVYWWNGITYIYTITVFKRKQL